MDYNIVNAVENDLETVFKITQSTVSTIYPHCYPNGAVDYFLALHSKESILKDIKCLYCILCQCGSRDGHDK